MCEECGCGMPDEEKSDVSGKEVIINKSVTEENDKIAHKIWHDLKDKEILCVNIMGAPGSGKTTISHIVISRYLEKYPNARVVVLTHGQNILKNQYIESLQEPHVDINFTFGEFDSGKQVLDSFAVVLIQETS